MKSVLFPCFLEVFQWLLYSFPSSHAPWRYVPSGSKPASQLECVIRSLPHLLTEDSVFLWSFCIAITCGKSEDNLCMPKKWRKFPLQKEPGPIEKRESQQGLEYRGFTASAIWGFPFIFYLYLNWWARFILFQSHLFLTDSNTIWKRKGFQFYLVKN